MAYETVYDLACSYPQNVSLTTVLPSPCVLLDVLPPKAVWLMPLLHPYLGSGVTCSKRFATLSQIALPCHTYLLPLSCFTFSTALPFTYDFIIRQFI